MQNASDQKLTSQQVAMLQKIGEFIQENSMSRFVLFAGRRSIHTEEVDRLRDGEGELGELKGRALERKRQCDDCAVHDAVGQYECHTFSPRSIGERS